MIQDEEGNLLEPVEKITVEVPNEHCNYATEMFMNRGGEFKDMNEISTTHKRIIFEITTRQSMGLKKQLITQTKGNLVISSEVIRHIPK